MELHSEHKCHAILQTYWVCSSLLKLTFILLHIISRFHVDPSSPSYIEEDDEKEELDSGDESDVDYEILSKIIQ